MEKHLESARSLMVSGGYTCVLTNGTETLTSTDRGVKPLLQWVNAGLCLTGFSAADKVVGKATAFLYCLLDVREVYTPVISAAARQVLEKHGIRVIWEQEVPFIWNRRHTAPCPMETAVGSISDAQDALAAIRETLKTL